LIPRSRLITYRERTLRRRRAERRIFAGARLGSQMVGLAQIILFGEGLAARAWAV